MRIGVDFGTTRIVVAAADRGNYPLVSFESTDGQVRDWFPPLVAIAEGQHLFGWDTWPAQAGTEYTLVRSLKRLLKEAGPGTQLEIAGKSVPLQQLLHELVSALRHELYTRSTLGAQRGEPLEVMLGVPANANSNQRFLTADAFRAAGFNVIGVLNEPSAASIEFGHRNRSLREGRSHGALLVYDLGGGTFDASLVLMDEATHTVVSTAGIPALGGDDFDEVLAGLALESSPIAAAEADRLTAAELFRLHEECRERKEALNPNTRKIVIDLDRVRPGWGDVSIPAAVFYERCRPMIEQTRDVVERLLAEHPEHSIDTLYVTGGGSELPPVSRILKETFGRRVRRSSYMRSATAIGLAIAADARRSGYRIKDRLTQHFGIWREADHGRNISFDVILEGGTELPAPGEPRYRVVRAYRPVHNVGHFRYVECSSLGNDAQPSGEVLDWDEVRFPFDPTLRDAADLSTVQVRHSANAASQWVEEEYTFDSSGAVNVRISNTSAGYGRDYRLGRWSATEARSTDARVTLRRRRKCDAGHAL
jgi:molecular chaperone DnaK (HSP70)